VPPGPAAGLTSGRWYRAVVRIGIVSDLHGNAAGLAAAIAHLGDVDELWCAGDIVNQSKFSDDTVELLRSSGARCVLGNHDDILLSPHGERARAASARPDLVGFLADQPAFVERSMGGKRVLMTHATPFAPHQEYVWPHAAELARMASLDVDYVILGHTHQAMAVRVGSVLVVNPGSAGQPRVEDGRPSLRCALLDTASGEVRLDCFPVPG